MDCSPWGRKESDTAEQLSLSLGFSTGLGADRGPEGAPCGYVS